MGSPSTPYDEILGLWYELGRMYTVAGEDARPTEGQERSDEPVEGAVAASADTAAAENREQREVDHASQTAQSGEVEPQEQPYERDGRWWFRRECRAIAGTERRDDGFHVTLCRRWRRHRGPCAGPHSASCSSRAAAVEAGDTTP